MKKLTAVFLALCMLMSLSACARSNSGNAEAPERAHTEHSAQADRAEPEPTRVPAENPAPTELPEAEPSLTADTSAEEPEAQDALSFYDVLEQTMARIGFDGFSEEQKEFCCGEILTVNEESAFFLYYEVPDGAPVDKGSYVALWVKRNGTAVCLTDRKIDDSEDPDVSVCSAAIRVADGSNYLSTYLRTVGSEDVSRECFYLIEEDLTLAYDFYSAQKVVSNTDGMLVHDEGSARYLINRDEVGRDEFFSVRNDLIDPSKYMVTVTLNPHPNYAEGIMPEDGYTFGMWEGMLNS